MGRAPGASSSTRRSVFLALVAVGVAAISLGQAPGEEPEPCPPPPAPPPLPSVGIALRVEPHERQPGTYQAKALLTDGITGRRLSQSWVAVKAGSFSDMRARVNPESGGGRTVDVYMTVSIGENEDEASLTTTYRLGERLLMKQETTITLGGARKPGL